MGRFAADRIGRRMRGGLALVAGLALVVGPLASPAAAQQLPGTTATFNPTASSSPGYLFSRPGFSLGLRGGMFVHAAEGEVFSFTRETFTLDDSDFRGISFGVEGAAWLGNRLEATFGMDVHRFTRGSEYRDWVEDDGSPEGLPIRQTTRLRAGPAATVGLRGYLFPRGEQLSRFIWVPKSWNVFGGAGIGLTGYELEQWGDFVDLDSGVIFTSDVDSDGYSGLAFVELGMETAITPRTALVLEARHQWAEAGMSNSFSRFEPVDLSGTRFTTGLRYRF